MNTFIKYCVIVILLINTSRGGTFASVPAKEPPGQLVGTISDKNSTDGLGWVSIYIEELKRTAVSHEDGAYHFFNLPAGTYSLKLFRVGYHDAGIKVEIVSGQEIEINIKMNPIDYHDTGVIVEEQREISEYSRAVVLSVSDKKLRQNLAVTVAKTIDNEPGISHRSMGPAPARPVMRGLGGDRLLMLEDGERTGDLSASSSDHAVVIEPMTAERIEVLRGPEALVYGSNTLGGVINVERDYVPTDVPHHFNGTATFQGESVNSGASGGLHFHSGAGPFAFRADGSYREAGDIRTPLGVLDNTMIQTANYSAGASFVQNWGFVGTAGNFYKSDYGIPPDPQGGHPKGVKIELNRYHWENKAEVLFAHPQFRKLSISHNFTRYEHSELEANNSVGMEFFIDSHHFKSQLSTLRLGPFNQGVIGFWGEHRDYRTAGLSFTPATDEISLALYILQKTVWHNWQISMAVRGDYKNVKPAAEKKISRQDFSLHIRERSFSDFSGAFRMQRNFSENLMWDATVMRTFRAPGVEELFSEGPHLAAYSYEVGNSELSKETAIGLESGLTFSNSLAKIRFAVFRNDIKGFIYPENTGRYSLRRADLLLYQHVGKHTRMIGFENYGEIRFTPQITLSGNISYVRGKLVESNNDLPRIPPLSLKTNLGYQTGSYTLNFEMRSATTQNRLGEFENLAIVTQSDYQQLSADDRLQIDNRYFERRPTDAFFVFALHGEYYFTSNKILHTVGFSVDNIFDTEYRHHLNRVKFVMPEPGRNFKILYKMYF